MDEFALIDRYFASARCAQGDPAVAVGIGDDCALLELAPGEQLAVSTDTLVAGRHFPVDCAGADLGQRALAVSVSDLAAVGAEPIGFTLALTLPSADENWLAGLAQGLDSMASRCGMALLGGDTCQGPLTLTLTVLGRLPRGQGLLRSGARPGDWVCVSGGLGEAAAALELVLAQREVAQPLARRLLERYWSPQPQLALGQQLRGRASAALDISDGLLADLGHIAKASGVAIWIDADQVPVAADLAVAWGPDRALELALGGGDDYQLAFTVAAEQWPGLQRDFPQLRRIGVVQAGAPGVHLRDVQGRQLSVPRIGYRHRW